MKPSLVPILKHYSFISFNSQEDIQLYIDTQVRLARTSLTSSNKPKQTCVHSHIKEEFTQSTLKHKSGADSKTTGSKNSSQVLKTPFFPPLPIHFFLPTFFLFLILFSLLTYFSPTSLPFFFSPSLPLSFLSFWGLNSGSLLAMGRKLLHSHSIHSVKALCYSSTVPNCALQF